MSSVFGNVSKQESSNNNAFYNSIGLGEESEIAVEILAFRFEDEGVNSRKRSSESTWR
jgi:hypothetical protein